MFSNIIDTSGVDVLSIGFTNKSCRHVLLDVQIESGEVG